MLQHKELSFKPTSILEEIGISKQELTDIVISGEVARNSCSHLHPVMFPGFYAYASRVENLRRLLIPKGWVPLTYKGIELICKPDKSIAIGTSTGGDGTGDISMGIESKYQKGRGTTNLVENNQLEFSDPSFNKVSQEEKNCKDAPKNTWYLMVNKVDNIIYAELCLPLTMDDERKISSAQRRIILDPIDLNEVRVTKANESDFIAPENNSYDDFIVDITKKD